MGKYDDIIHLPHPVSKRHPQMTVHDRAAQFAPFAALTGFGGEIEKMREQKRRENDRTGREKGEGPGLYDGGENDIVDW